ncbi:hypothetical protein [Rhodovulum visakhapatnamense]|uniref:Uncharacterized protein n=1 Tax=Rhodovulum visakhapatnamense TaxID=364297 RepID=A0ABS1RLA6_9RHOB|nr:hypothetical protein [Rhodovulum visakhapatnamense]MBL3571814.1 hypothetical protein [Rhodovulum visakhapatnamense]MBL3580435.1 hypothetical protein [Rhodovulum visakhapatnamense]
MAEKSVGTDKRIERYIAAAKRAGSAVQRVVIEGRKIELVLSDERGPDLSEFDAVDLRR